MKLINSLSSLCVAGLTVFATGCSSNDDEPGKINRDLPFGRYSIKGNVSAADSGLPLEAEMRISIPTDPSGVKSIQTNKTEDDGKYYFSDETNVYEAFKVVCIPKDPAYDPDSVVVKLGYWLECFVGGMNPMYKGVAFHEVNFQLKRNDLPFGQYSIKGNVSAADSGEPLRAEMRIALPDNPSDVKSLQIQRSEMDGTYLFSDDTNVYEALKVVCIPEDRTYAPDSVVVTLKYEGDCYLPGITNPLDRGRAFHEVNFQLKNRKN